MSDNTNCAEQIKAAIGPLVRAAIDAYMKTSVSVPFTTDGNKYSGDGGRVTVSRPDENGNGGGNWEGSGIGEFFVGEQKDKDFSTAFNNIRTWFNDRLSSWTTFPKPSNILNTYDRYLKQVVATLARSADKIKLPSGQSVQDASVNGTYDSSSPTALPSYHEHGSMGTNLDISYSMAQLKGDAMRTFSNVFQTKLPLVIDDLCYVTNIHASTLLSEYVFFVNAGNKVLELVKKTTTAFNKIAQSGGADFELAVDIIGWGLSFLTLPAGGNAIATGKLALTVADDVNKASKRHSKQSASPSTYEEMRDLFKTSLADIEEDLKTGEQAVAKALGNNISEVSTDQGKGFEEASLHLVPAPITSGSSQAEMDDASVNDISDKLLKVADLVETAYRNLQSIRLDSLLRRDSPVGLIPAGPSEKYHDFQQIIYELLLDLKWQLEEGVINLKLAMHDFEERDADSSAALQRFSTEYSLGSGVDPWDGTYVTSDEVLNRDPYFENHDDHNPRTPTQAPGRQELAQEKGN